MADPFLHTAVATDGVDVVIHDGTVGLIIGRGQMRLGQRHADSRGIALPQRPGGGLHARCDPVLGMAGGEAAELAELLELIQRQIVAGQMKQAVDQHGAVAAGQHEPVAVEPLGISRVVAQEARPQHVGDRRHAHRHAGVAGVGLLDAVHGQAADDVGAKLIKLVVGRRNRVRGRSR